MELNNRTNLLNLEYRMKSIFREWIYLDYEVIIQDNCSGDFKRDQTGLSS